VGFLRFLAAFGASRSKIRFLTQCAGVSPASSASDCTAAKSARDSRVGITTSSNTRWLLERPIRFVYFVYAAPLAVKVQCIDMPNIDPRCWIFYLEGRGERRLLKSPQSESDIANIVLKSGGDVREAIMAACRRAATPLEVGKAKSRWLAESKEAISEAEVDGDAAYAAFLQGRIDELAYATEENVLVEIGNAVGAEGGDEDDDEEDDESDEDDDL
jgi:hypothetical protein